MKKRIRGSGISSPLLKTLLRVLFVLVTACILSLASAAILSGLENPYGSIDAAGLATMLITGALTGFICSRVSGGIAPSVITTLISLAIMLVVALVLGGGGICGKALMNMLCYLLVSLFFAYLGSRRSQRRRKRRQTR